MNEIVIILLLILFNGLLAMTENSLTDMDSDLKS